MECVLLPVTRPSSSTPSSFSTTPTCGLSVVNGYAATLGVACDNALSNVDFPTLGRPTSPTSAITLNSTSTIVSSPGSPGVQSMGFRLTVEENIAFPIPPSPPCATMHELLGRRRS